MKLSTLAPLVFALVLSPVPALAQQPPSAPARPEGAGGEGKAHFERAVQLFHEGDFRAALVEFRRAQEMTGSFKMLYNIAQTEYELQDYAGALRSFQRYLEAGGAEIDAGRRAEVEGEIKGLAARVAHIQIKSNVDGAEVLVDDVLVGRTPLADAVLVSIGRRKVTLQKDGVVSAPRVVELAGGDRSVVRIDLTAAAPAPTAPPIGPVSPPSRTGLWASLAVTGGLAVGAGIVGGLALGAHGDTQTKLGTLGVTAAEIEAAHSKTQTLALVADILGGTAIAMVGVTIVLAVTTGKSDAPAPPKAATVTFGSRGLAVGGTF